MTPAKKEPAPVVTLGPVAAPTVRTGAQIVTGEFIIRGVELFLWTPNSDQRPWLVSLLTVTIALVQNVVERRRGRKLVGVIPK